MLIARGDEDRDMSESATRQLSYDELLALKQVALDGGLSGSRKLSCGELADQLGVSNQTASRRLQSLESAGYVEREMVADGQWLSVTDAGESELRSEYADYRRLFDRAAGLTLTGTVTTGMGEGKHYISLPGYESQFEARLGYTPFPGTLNLELTDESIRSRGELPAQSSIPIDSWQDDDRTYGAATCYPAHVVCDGRSFETTHIIVPDRTHHDEEQIELIAPVKLRDELALDDGDTLTAHLTEAETA